ncbi:MAG TPA: TetR family transcriptional regulator [Desulfomonilia bacterium]
MMSTIKRMKISEFSFLTGVPVSTIRYYIWEGILPPPVKAGRTRAYYNQEHIDALGLVRQKQIMEHKPLSVIREEMSHVLSRSHIETNDENIPAGRREDIITSAIEVFFAKGLAETTIADIASEARISKETFYLYFKNKEELFIACADRIFHEMYRDVWQEIRNEKDMMRRFRKRAIAYFSSYPRWVVMMNLLRSNAVGDNPVFKEKFRQVISEIVGPITQDIERMQKLGEVRDDIDINLAGYIVMGMSEYAAALIHQGVFSESEIIENLEIIFWSGLSERN